MKKGVLLNFARSHISSDRVRSGYEITWHLLYIAESVRTIFSFELELRHVYGLHSALDPQDRGPVSVFLRYCMSMAKPKKGSVSIS